MPTLKTASTRKAKRRDKLARWVITLGGITVIASVIAILALIVGVTVPLFRAPRADVAATCRLPSPFRRGAGGEGVDGKDSTASPSSLPTSRPHPDPLPKGEETVLRLGIDMDMDGANVTALIWSDSGTVAWVDLRSGEVVGREHLLSPGGDAKSTLRQVDSLGAGQYSLSWSDGAASLVEIVAQRANRKNTHTAPYVVRSLASIKGTEVVFANIASKTADHPPKTTSVPVHSQQVFIRRSDAGAITRAARLSDGTIAILRQVATDTPMGDEEIKTYQNLLQEKIIAHISAMTMDHEGSTLYAGTSDGRLVRWQLDEKGEVAHREVVLAFADGRTVTALALVLGDVSLAVGDANGELTVWSPVNADGTRKLQTIHKLQPHESAIQEILPSGRNKSIASLDANGVVHLDHMTSERHVLTIASEQDRPLRQVAFGPRGDTLLGLDGSGALTAWQIDSGCPEISFKTLFGKVLYEGYDKPEYVWQTTGGEDFEPKFSLVPLIFGTLKGTFYAMFFAVPLALFGAVYVSYFTTPGFRRTIKPLVEIMATVPSVVIGFLIALWLAPIIERWLLAFFISLIAVPATFVVFMAIWQLLRRSDWARRVENGYEFLVVLPVLLAGVGIAAYVAPDLERWLFVGTARWHVLAILASLVMVPVTVLAFRATSRFVLRVVVPASSLAFGAIWRSWLRFNWAKRISGSHKYLPLLAKYFLLLGKYLLLLSAIAVGAAIAMLMAGFLESWLFPADFNGSFRQWLFRGPLGMQYDQRNCIIIAFGLGFTVIPIIFSIAEDSLSNVPYNMTAASMAVGASRWQTLWRVVLPSASPGIFAAMMIGFGRAVGETMIVLMATGNTPILDWCPFNGMRTLSANIAVEIPEAPVGGTLYRVLFLCAVLLFLLTFSVNTAAELVRQRLRKRFGRF